MHHNQHDSVYFSYSMIMYKRFSVPKEIPRHPCNPSPCGPNANCRERNGAGSCTCVDDFYGDPYLGCRPECVMNTDCTMDRACFNNKCVNPCSGACGQNAECRVTNHAPSCSCLPGYSGNPLHACTPVLSKTYFLYYFFLFSYYLFYCILTYLSTFFHIIFSSTGPCRSLSTFALWTV